MLGQTSSVWSEEGRKAVRKGLLKMVNMKWRTWKVGQKRDEGIRVI